MVKRVAGYGYTVHLLAQKVPTTVKKNKLIFYKVFYFFLKKVGKPFGDPSRPTLMFTADD